MHLQQKPSTAPKFGLDINSGIDISGDSNSQLVAVVTETKRVSATVRAPVTVAVAVEYRDSHKGLHAPQGRDAGVHVDVP